MRLFGILLVLALWASPADAQERWIHQRGNVVWDYCKNEGGLSWEDGVSWGFCLGTATACADALESMGQACQPLGTTDQQVRNVFVKYLKDHPEERHEVAVDLAYRAFAEVWPCP